MNRQQIKTIILVVLAVALLIAFAVGFVGDKVAERNYEVAMATYEVELVAAAKDDPEVAYALGRRRDRWRDRDNYDPDSYEPQPEPGRRRIFPIRPRKDRLYYRLYHLAGSGLCVVGVLFLGGIVVKGWFGK